MQRTSLRKSGDVSGHVSASPAEKATNYIVIKRGRGTGFSGIENLLLFEDNTRMSYGDARKVALG